MTPFDFKPLNQEVLPTDFIIDAPSLVTPLLLKKRQNNFKKLIKEFKISDKNDTINNQTSINNLTTQNSLENNDDDDVMIIKVIDKNASNENGSKSTNNNHKNLEDVLRSTLIASLTTSTKPRKDDPILTINNYFDSSPGQLLMDIGYNKALEVALRDQINQLSKKIKKERNLNKNSQEELENFKEKFYQIKANNEPYKSPQSYKCHLCSFRSESFIELNAHLEKPHQNYKREFLCNWCQYKIRNPDQLIYHCFMTHKQRCYIEKPGYPYSCQFCHFDAKSKKRLESHLVICEENFSSMSLLTPQNGDLEYPAITSKFIGRDDVVTYARVLRDIRLASYNPNVVRISGSSQNQNGYQAIFVVPSQNNNASPIMPRIRNNSGSNLIVGPNMNHIGSSSNVIGDSLSGQHKIQYQSEPQPNTQLLHFLTKRKTTPKRFGTLQYPQNQSSFGNGKLIVDNISEVIINQNTSHPREDKSNEDFEVFESVAILEPSSTKRNNFVICEICDGYIKDLDQLKSHMHSLHKIKLNQSTLESRPPLNCQKCNWRFFTDQGLERHLLGAHGLVTSHMRELVEKNLDSGRCTVCGRAYANKLVAHMRDIHKSTLKPAHLSYKCTACSTSFNMYRTFEKHVYANHREAINRT